MPKTKTEQAVQETPLTATLNVAMAVDAIKVTTIKRSFVKQMPRMTYPEFLDRVKNGTVITLGIARDLKDIADCLVLKTPNDRLVTVAEIIYREYLHHIANFEHNIRDSKQVDIFVEAQIRKIPQLFTV